MITRIMFILTFALVGNLFGQTMSPSPWEKKTNPDADEWLSIEKQRSEAIVKLNEEWFCVAAHSRLLKR
jgi:hypothetical protein